MGFDHSNDTYQRWLKKGQDGELEIEKANWKEKWL